MIGMLLRNGTRVSELSECLACDAADVPFERRDGDRRKRKPGFAGLWSAIFGQRQEDDEPGT